MNYNKDIDFSRVKDVKNGVYKISLIKYNKLFASRGSSFLKYAIVTKNDDTAEIRFYTTNIGKFLFLLYLPIIFCVIVLREGIKGTGSDILDVLFDRQRNSCSVDYCSKDRDIKSWKKLMFILK